MKKAIVTVLFGNYDTLKPAPKYKDWDSILITNNNYSDLKGWTLHKVESENPIHESRAYKWLLHEVLPKYDLYCYLDGSMELLMEPPSERTFFSHSKRRSVKQEMQKIISLGKCNREIIKKQLEYYDREEFPDTFGMYQNGFFIRENNKEMNMLCSEVYNVIYEYSNRDQIALPFAIFKTGASLGNIKNGRYLKQYFKLHEHGVSVPNVHHITPGRSDLNFGKSINDIVKGLPDDDWICLRDIDTLPAYHENYFKQCEDIAQSGAFGLVGCMTNRLGLKHQLHNGIFSNDTDWINHRAIAKERSTSYGSQVKETKEYIGGLFMLFPKSVWLKVGGFPEGGIRVGGSFIDWHFSNAVAKAGYKIGIAEGIYLIHLYRPDAVNPKRAVSHLL